VIVATSIAEEGMIYYVTNEIAMDQARDMVMLLLLIITIALVIINP